MADSPALHTPEVRRVLTRFLELPSTALGRQIQNRFTEICESDAVLGEKCRPAFSLYFELLDFSLSPEDYDANQLAAKAKTFLKDNHEKYFEELFPVERAIVYYNSLDGTKDAFAVPMELAGAVLPHLLNELRACDSLELGCSATVGLAIFGHIIRYMNGKDILADKFAIVANEHFQRIAGAEVGHFVHFLYMAGCSDEILVDTACPLGNASEHSSLDHADYISEFVGIAFAYGRKLLAMKLLERFGLPAAAKHVWIWQICMKNPHGTEYLFASTVDEWVVRIRRQIAARFIRQQVRETKAIQKRWRMPAYRCPFFYTEALNTGSIARCTRSAQCCYLFSMIGLFEHMTQLHAHEKNEFLEACYSCGLWKFKASDSLSPLRNWALSLDHQMYCHPKNPACLFTFVEDKSPEVRELEMGALSRIEFPAIPPHPHHLKVARPKRYAADCRSVLIFRLFI